jgi:hypothetical protein
MPAATKMPSRTLAPKARLWLLLSLLQRPHDLASDETEFTREKRGSVQGVTFV